MRMKLMMVLTMVPPPVAEADEVRRVDYCRLTNHKCRWGQFPACPWAQAVACEYSTREEGEIL